MHNGKASLINQIIDEQFAWVDAKIRSRRDFWEELEAEADAMKDADAANSLRADISMGQSKEAGEQKKAEIDAQKKAAKEAEKALQRYNDALKSVLVKDNGTINKALSDYQTELNKIDRKYEELAEKAKAAYPDVNRLNMELQSLGFYKAQEKAGAQGKFVGTFEGWAKSIIDEGMYGYDMTNWADKDVFEIRKIAKALSELEIPQEIKDALLQMPAGKVLLGNLTEEVDKLKKKLKEGTLDPAFWRALGKTIKGVSKAFSGVYDAAKEYAETVNPNLTDTIELLEDTAKAVSEIATYALKNDWITATAIAVAFLVEQLIKAETRTIQLRNEIAAAQEDIRHSMEMDKISNAGESIFGANNLEKFRVGVISASEALERLNAAMNETTKVKIDLNSGVWWKDLFAAINNERAGKVIQEYGSILGILQHFNLPAYDENGLLNRESIEKLKELDKANVAYYDKVLNNLDEYEAALKAVEGVMEELVGDIADSAADKIIDTWIEAGDAALDYADILDDVARAYSKLIIKDMIMQALPENLAKNLTALAYQGNEAEFMSTLADALSSIEALRPYMEKVLAAFDPYFVKEGDTASSVGAGIKSITEDTAGLLAAYLNAIRADVAMGNIQRGEILSLFREYMNQEAAPSYAEYLARIEAHTESIYARQGDILDRLTDVVGTITQEGNDGPAFRVYKS